MKSMKRLVLVGLVLLASVVVLVGCKNDSVPEILKYTVTFDANGGTGEMTPQTFTANESQKLKENTFSKAGEIFLGWSKSTTGAVEYQNQEEISLTFNITLYAQWTPGIVVTSSTVESLSLESVTGEYHIVVEGKIDTTVISTFRKKINAAGEGAAIHLDLSLTEGLTEIPNTAFMGCGKLSSVSIPSSVTSIGDSAFRDCNGLTSVIMQEGVISIGALAFFDCNKLACVTIPSSITSIGDYAFEGCDALTSVEIPASVTSIGDSAFRDCNGLTSVIMQEGVISIGALAFFYCNKLACVTIPSSITSIGDYAFEGCVALTQIKVAAGNINYKVYDSRMLIDKNGCLLFYPSATGDISIPNDIITSIGSDAFNNCDNLTSVIIPASVTSIGDDAFNNCDNLTSVIIPASVTSIGDDAFNNCDNLTSVIIPASVTSIGDDAFYGCVGLTSVTIPSSVTSIGKGAFLRCDSITDVTFEDPYNWYVTENQEDAENKTGGKLIDDFSYSNIKLYLVMRNNYWYKKNTDESI